MSNAFFDLIQRAPISPRRTQAKATLDFPSVAAAGTQSLTVSVSGAEVGDAVLVVPGVTPVAGLLFDAQVTARGVVAVRAHNITAAAIDPAAGVFRVIVIKI